MGRDVIGNVPLLLKEQEYHPDKWWFYAMQGQAPS